MNSFNLLLAMRGHCYRVEMPLTVCVEGRAGLG
jgi:hypothetical protein